MPEPIVSFAVLDTPTQEIAIHIRGDAAFFAELSEAAGQTEPADLRGDDSMADAIPDPVAAFVAAAQLHMFVTPLADPQNSDAELVSRSADPGDASVSYRLRLRNVHRGALRVLANLLVARMPEFIRMDTVKAPSHLIASGLDLKSLEYPSASGHIPFPVDYEMPVRSSRDRFLQIAFARPPQPEVLKMVYSGLATWSQLPLFGAYPRQNMKPWQSSAGPSPAFLFDPYTVEQAFPDIFLCDDDCYACVVNWALYLHRSVWPVARIVLR